MPKRRRTKPPPKPSREPKTIGYLRVSTKDQDLEKNRSEILHHANEKGLIANRLQWVEEKVSGTKDWKMREIGRMISSLHKGDSIIVNEMSRLGRSTLQILEIMQECKQKGINVYAVKGGWSLNGTIESKVLLTIFAMIAEIEHDLISQRTREALAARKKSRR